MGADITSRNEQLESDLQQLQLDNKEFATLNQSLSVFLDKNEKYNLTSDGVAYIDRLDQILTNSSSKFKADGPLMLAFKSKLRNRLYRNSELVKKISELRDELSQEEQYRSLPFVQGMAVKSLEKVWVPLLKSMKTQYPPTGHEYLISLFMSIERKSDMCRYYQFNDELSKMFTSSEVTPFSIAIRLFVDFCSNSPSDSDMQLDLYDRILLKLQRTPFQSTTNCPNAG